MRKLKFAPLPTIAYACLLPLLISLGFWQWHRADEKQQLLNLYAQNQAAPAVLLNADTAINVDNSRYRKVTLNGHYEPQQQFLLDNQISEHKVGYLVFTPFKLANSNKAVLINRGWLVAPAQRSQLPDVSFTSTTTTIEGTLNAFPRVGMASTAMSVPTDSNPSVVQVIDSTVLAKKLGYELLPFQIELAANQNHSFKREQRSITTIPPERHIGYAVQWFALAATLTFLFFWYSFKK
jgi:surfeit locus 1 family protein